MCPKHVGLTCSSETCFECRVCGVALWSGPVFLGLLPGDCPDGSHAVMHTSRTHRGGHTDSPDVLCLCPRCPVRTVPAGSPQGTQGMKPTFAGGREAAGRGAPPHHTHTYAHAHACTYTDACMYAHIHVCTHYTYMHVHTHMQAHTHIQAIRMYIHTYTCTNTRMHTVCMSVEATHSGTRGSATVQVECFLQDSFI